MKLRTPLVALAAMIVVAGGAYAWRAGPQLWCAATGSSHEGGETAIAAAGTPKGAFDPAMAGCRFSCSTREAFQPRDVIPQPGARAGDLTQCPVSGVVFTVAADRPHVVVADREYVVCCDQCKTRLEKAPARFVKL